MSKMVVKRNQNNHFNEGGFNMNFQGIIIGVMAFLIIGVFHPIVIASEYYVGKKIWPLFLIVGILCIGISLFIEKVIGTIKNESKFKKLILLQYFLCKVVK